VTYLHIWLFAAGAIGLWLATLEWYIRGIRAEGALFWRTRVALWRANQAVAIVAFVIITLVMLLSAIFPSFR
jgi:hypothetical protein